MREHRALLFLIVHSKLYTARAPGVAVFNRSFQFVHSKSNSERCTGRCYFNTFILKLEDETRIKIGVFISLNYFQINYFLHNAECTGRCNQSGLSFNCLNSGN